MISFLTRWIVLLIHLIQALRKAAESRNEEITVSEGLKVGKYGLPELLPPKPPMARTVSITPLARIRPPCYHQLSIARLLARISPPFYLLFGTLGAKTTPDHSATTCKRILRYQCIKCRLHSQVLSLYTILSLLSRWLWSGEER